MGNKQQLHDTEGTLNPENVFRHLNINVNESFDSKVEGQNINGLDSTRVYDSNSTSYMSGGSPTRESPPKSKKKKKEVKLSVYPNQQQTQIGNAKREYEKKRMQNQGKLQQIRRRRQTYNQIYFDDEDSHHCKGANSVLSTQQQQVTIWGKKVNLNQDKKMKSYYQYRYPKEIGQDKNNEYTNWEIYKKQMSKTTFKQLQDEEDQLVLEECELRQKYESLVRQMNELYVGGQGKSVDGSGGINKNSLSIDIIKSQTSQHHEQNSPRSSNERIVTPSFHTGQKIVYEDSPIISHKKRNYLQTAPIVQNDVNDDDYNNREILLFEVNNDNNKNNNNNNDNNYNSNYNDDIHDDSQVVDEWVHPQNIITSDTEYRAKQIYFYENYLMKKKSSYVPLSALSLMQQYPAKKQPNEIARPVRNKQTVVDPYLKRLQKSRINKSYRIKSKSKSKSKVNRDEVIYTKVYEKVPRKRQAKLYSPENRRFESAVNFYPWEDSAQRMRKKAEQYPSQMRVDDSMHRGDPQQGELYFHFISKQNDQRQQQWQPPKSTFYSISDSDKYDQPDEKRNAMKYSKYQRMVESQILQKVRFKKL